MNPDQFFPPAHETAVQLFRASVEVGAATYCLQCFLAYVPRNEQGKAFPIAHVLAAGARCCECKAHGPADANAPGHRVEMRVPVGHHVPREWEPAIGGEIFGTDEQASTFVTQYAARIAVLRLESPHGPYEAGTEFRIRKIEKDEG
jgi:hypothetical protein